MGLLSLIMRWGVSVVCIHGVCLHPWCPEPFLVCSFRVWTSFLLARSLKPEALARRPLLLNLSLINHNSGGKREHHDFSRKLVEGPFLAPFSIPRLPTHPDKSNVASMKVKLSIKLDRLNLLTPSDHHLLPSLSQPSLPMVSQHSKGLSCHSD